ncbi:MAG: L-serine ammonia-lyase, iron-sulfur-dependent, subunit alpha [Thermovirgaceae bacterium]|nr:L-serine ammonia-lyase, iron-sulfur-dependent, subunit alpha [Thermovirgaceae bacterium]
MEQHTALNVLHQHTFLTIGCTDPVAIGLAVAHACQGAEGKIRKVRVRLDRNIYKDAVSVGIPGTRSSGVDLAVALAIIKGRPEAGLELFKDIEPGDVEQAKAFLKDHEVRFELDEEATGIRITATVVTEKGVYEALIEGAHDRLLEKKVNGHSTFRAETACDEATLSGRDSLQDLHDISISEIVDTIEALKPAELLFLLKGVTQNLHAAQAGLAEHAGLELGKYLQSLLEEGALPDSIINRIRILAAAAADARMGGIKVPVFGCFGSGNHGITYFITVGEMGRHLGKNDEEIAQALALGLLVVGVIKTRTGILTPHCGCAVAAGTGAAAAVTYMLGGTCGQVESAVQLMTANLTGMLCDGAKYGCALKIATSVAIAIETAYLAQAGATVPKGNGIVGDTFQETMDNLAIITDRGMKNVDQAVLDVLLAGQS